METLVKAKTPISIDIKKKDLLKIKQNSKLNKSVKDKKTDREMEEEKIM